MYLLKEVMQCTFKERLCKLPLKRGNSVYFLKEVMQSTFKEKFVMYL